MTEPGCVDASNGSGEWILLVSFVSSPPRTSLYRPSHERSEFSPSQRSSLHWPSQWFHANVSGADGTRCPDPADKRHFTAASGYSRCSLGKCDWCTGPGDNAPDDQSTDRKQLRVATDTFVIWSTSEMSICACAAEFGTQQRRPLRWWWGKMVGNGFFSHQFDKALWVANPYTLDSQPQSDCRLRPTGMIVRNGTYRR